MWMAKSEKECQGWIRAINQAMIGDMDDTRDAPFDVSTYQNAIDDFQAVQTSMKDVKTRQEYLVAINSLLPTNIIFGTASTHEMDKRKGHQQSGK
jgi:hypothetical protein